MDRSASPSSLIGLVVSYRTCNLAFLPLRALLLRDTSVGLDRSEPVNVARHIMPMGGLRVDADKGPLRAKSAVVARQPRKRKTLLPL